MNLINFLFGMPRKNFDLERSTGNLSRQISSYSELFIFILFFDFF